VHENAYGGRLEPTAAAVAAYIDRVAGRLASGDALILAATGREDGGFLGSTMLFCFEAPAPAEIGYWLAPWARGRGLAVATIAITLRWGFEELGLTRIQGLTAPSNDASQRAMERAGMRREGLVEDYEHPQVGREDVVIYAAP
jgi:RimJ/RimL family protein N-acetyltransferase